MTPDADVFIIRVIRGSKESEHCLNSHVAIAFNAHDLRRDFMISFISSAHKGQNVCCMFCTFCVPDSVSLASTLISYSVIN